MDKDKLTAQKTRRKAADTFSIEPFQAEINERFDSSVHDSFTARELERMGNLANRALHLVGDADDPYIAEVFVTLHEGDDIYDMQTDPPQRIEGRGQILYGYINGFTVDVLPGGTKRALAAAFEEYSDDVTEHTHSYVVPLALEGSSRGVQVVDAPTPVAESGVEFGLGSLRYGVKDRAREDREQAAIHSLLNIVEDDLFTDNTVDVHELEENIKSLQDTGFIEQLDDMTVACHYYLQQCLHDSDPWKFRPQGIVECFDETKPLDAETAERKGTKQWVSEELTVVGVVIRIDEKSSDCNIKCDIYARSEDGMLYRHVGQNSDSDDRGMVLYRESGTYSEDESDYEA
jgi:hypothetical protein